MSSVNLSRRVALEAPVRTPDNAGGYTETWSALGTLWAEIKPRTGRYSNHPGGTVSTMAATITVRAAPQGHSNRPAPGQRFRLGARLFEIEAVSELEPKAHYLVCHCEEETAP